MRVGYFPGTQDPPRGENVGRMINEIIEQAKMCEAVGFMSIRRMEGTEIIPPSP
jgi:hypothetical protein